MSSMSGSGGGAGAGGGGGAGDGGGGGGGGGHRDPAAAATSDAPGGGGRIQGAGGGGVQGAGGVGVGGGGGVGVGGGGGDRDVPGRHPLQAAITEPILFVEGRIEAYDGENEELDMLETLTSSRPQEPPSLDSVLKDELTTVAAEIVQVQQYHGRLGPSDLQSCLHQGDWNRALDILTQMVQDKAAAGNAVNTEENPLDIKRAHPELVLLLRGAALFDLKRKGFAIRGASYYNNYISPDYPDGFHIGIKSVDRLLEEIKRMAQAEVLPRKCRFTDNQNTCRSVNDYLKIYFPSFRDVEIKDGVVPIGLFGEKKGNIVRCLACHDFKKKKYTEKKLYYHQLHDPKGKQARCPSSTEYIRQKIRDVLQAATAAPPPDGADGPTTTPPTPPDGAQGP